MDIATSVATELGRPLTEAEGKQVALWTADLTFDIQQRFAGRDMPDPELVDRVLRKVIVAALRNPNPGLTSVEVAVDDARTVRRYSASGAGLVITPDLWALLGWHQYTEIQTVTPYCEPWADGLQSENYYPVWPL